MKYAIKSPVEGYAGISAGVRFKDGVGVTDNPKAADWLKSKGYEVTEEKPDKQEPPKEQPKEPAVSKGKELSQGGNSKGGKK